MKNVSLITFAQFICLVVIFFGLGYYAYVTYMSFNHAIIPNMVMDIKGNVNIWMTSALSFGIGTTVSSQNKDKTIADLNANIKDALASTPANNALAPTIPADKDPLPTPPAQP